jgi:hypothetical protein
MEQRLPQGYQRILEGDRESIRRFSGHGSAIAQAYNHSILPLSSSRDKQTQILWGLKDFQQRFKRDPEGMWLPETAVDTETLEILSGEGVKFTILAPRQAAQMRPLQSSSWISLEYGIDSRRPYLCKLPSGRSIGLFFYDGGLATAVAFERLLYSGENFARRLLSRFDPEGDSAQLMHVATDGETYGHHHTHGDMALAFALHYIEANKLATLTNYGEYFANHPPSHEVRIHERSSWSCAHGVSRWESDCGCNSGGRHEWNQGWRGPLRAALDWLRDDLAAAYEEDAGTLVRDPWQARDEFISVVLDRSRESGLAFLSRHCPQELTFAEEVRLLRLLEMQRHLMLMYTSCGWFFDEPTGPETVQVLQYAARAVQLGEQLFGGDREAEFLRRLESVHSNIPEFGNGRSIYERFVKPAMLDLPGVAAHYAISSLFDGYKSSDSIYSYTAALHDVQIFERGKLKLAAGSARITSRITHAQVDFDFAVLHMGGHRLRAGVSPREPNSKFARMVSRAAATLEHSNVESCLKIFDHFFGETTYSLKSLFRDERSRIVSQIVNSTLEDIDKLYGDIYEHHTSLIGFLRELSMPLPPILHVSSEFVLSNAIRRCLAGDDPGLQRTQQLLDTARQHGINLDSSLQTVFRQRLEDLMQRWAENPLRLGVLDQLMPLVSLMRCPPFEGDLWNAQNAFYELMKAINPLPSIDLDARWINHFQALGEALGVAVLEPFISKSNHWDQETFPVKASSVGLKTSPQSGVGIMDVDPSVAVQPTA